MNDQRNKYLHKQSQYLEKKSWRQNETLSSYREDTRSEKVRTTIPVQDCCTEQWIAVLKQRGGSPLISWIPGRWRSGRVKWEPPENRREATAAEVTANTTNEELDSREQGESSYWSPQWLPDPALGRRSLEKVQRLSQFRDRERQWSN